VLRVTPARAQVTPAQELTVGEFLGQWLAHVRGRVRPRTFGGYESLLRINARRFESRSSVRTWLYRIATNACLNALAERPRRALPSGLVPASGPLDPPRQPSLEPVWLEPYPDRMLEELEDPAARYARRETIELAFLAAIHLLPPRQRAVLVLRDVLEWSAPEVAELLNTSTASVHSALQRARATLRRAGPDRRAGHRPDPRGTRALGALRACLRTRRRTGSRATARRGRRDDDAARSDVVPRTRRRHPVPRTSGLRGPRPDRPRTHGRQPAAGRRALRTKTQTGTWHFRSRFSP
jgi:RNA polymerase sigma factor (sigma-70 family)